MIKYNSRSPWRDTEIINSQYLDILEIRPVPASMDDILYAIQMQYEYRPDLLAYDLYGDRRFWWVFAQRNMNIIKDPVYDFVTGVEIYLPDARAIKELLG